jgi:hypothetical protein
MQFPVENATYNAIHHAWIDNQANAGEWTKQVLQAQSLDREQHKKDVETWEKTQEKWMVAWAIAQGAYAAAQVLLANNALDAAKDAADKQYDLANRQMVIAEEEYARFKEHFAPCENATADEECARPEYTEPIEDEANRAVVEVRMQFSNAQLQLQRRRNRYCVGAAIAGDREFAIQQALAVGQAKERARRFLEGRQFDRQQVYYNRKMQALNLGRGMPAQAIQGIGAAANLTAQGTEIALAARNQFAGAILSGLGGLLGAGVSAYAGPVSPFGQGGRMGTGIGGLGAFDATTSFGSSPGFGTGLGSVTGKNMNAGITPINIA